MVKLLFTLPGLREMYHPQWSELMIGVCRYFCFLGLFLFPHLCGVSCTVEVGKWGLTPVRLVVSA